MDFFDDMIAWENGELSDTETIVFFAKLIKAKMVYNLQGCYGRMASRLIENGYISPEGEILDKDGV
jgi:hypothetical protein